MPKLLITVLIAAIGACSLMATTDPVIDTWPIGKPVDCRAEATRCEELINVGLAGLAARNPGHAPVVGVRLHAEGAFVDPVTGNQFLMTRSGGCCRVLVLELADGRVHAIGVGNLGISDEAAAIPWLVQPSEP
jgi:hypothetical protein